MPAEKHFYEVIVGNIGKVYEGANYSSALRAYGNYVRASKMGHGRAGGEQVSLWKDGNPIKEHDATEPGYTSNPGSKKIVGVALNPSGKFLGFIDGGGRIRRGRLRKVRVRNPGTMATLSQVQAADGAGEHSGRDSGPASTTAIKREFNSWFNYRKDSLGLAELNHLQKRQLWGAFIRGFRRGAR